MGIELGNLAVLRTFRVLRALKTVAIVPGKYKIEQTLYYAYIYIILFCRCFRRFCNFHGMRRTQFNFHVFIDYRIKDYRRSCDRIREKPQGCHNINNIFTICVRIIGITNLYGRVNAKMHQRISHRWVSGKFNPRKLAGVHAK